MTDCMAQHLHIAGFFNIPGFWDGEIATRLKLMKDYNKKTGKNMTISLVPQQDATDVWDGGLNDVLKYVDFLILNETEAKCIAGCGSESNETICNDKIAKHFHKSSPNTHVIVTRGPRGAVVFHAQDIVLEQSTPREIENPADPTGAGDAFAAGFIYGFLTNGDAADDALKWGLKWGCTMGTCNVMVRGASTPCEKQTIESMLQELA